MTKTPNHRERGDVHQRAGRYWRSVAAYLAALTRREADRAFLTQQIGVSGVQTRILLPLAPALYALAYAEATTNVQRGNIRRDQARLFAKLGFRARGEQYIKESIELLNRSNDRTAYAVSLGYAGLIKADNGFLMEGYATLASADEVLAAGSDRQLEFNVKLHFIDVLLRLLRQSDKSSAFLNITDQALREANALTKRGIGAKQQVNRLRGYQRTFDSL